MPRIPLYQQERLASQMVGTPGVDSTGNILANSIQQGAASQAEAALYAQRQGAARDAQFQRSVGAFAQDVGQGVANDISSYRTFQRAAEKQNQAFANAVHADSIMDKLQREMIHYKGDLQERQLNERLDTDKLMPEYESKAAEIFDRVSKSNDLQNKPGILAEVSGKWGTLVQSNRSWVNEFKHDLDVKNAQRNVYDSFDDFKVDMTNAKTLEQALEFDQNFRNMNQSAYLALGSKGVEELAKSQREGWMQYLMVAADRNPSQMTQDGAMVPGEAIQALYAKDGEGNDRLSFLTAEDRKQINDLDEKFRNRDANLIREKIEIANETTEMFVDSLVASATDPNSDPQYPTEAYAKLVQLERAENAKPVSQRDPKLIHKLTEALKDVSSMASSYDSKQFERERSRIEGVRQEIADEENRYNRLRTLRTQLEDDRRRSPEAAAAVTQADGRLVSLVERAEGKKNKGGKITVGEVRELRTEFNQLWADRYISFDNYRDSLKRISEIAEKGLPKELKAGYSPAGTDEWFPPDNWSQWIKTERSGPSAALTQVMGKEAQTANGKALLTERIRRTMNDVVAENKLDKNKLNAVEINKIRAKAERKIVEEEMQAWALEFYNPVPEPEMRTKPALPVRGNRAPVYPQGARQLQPPPEPIAMEGEIPRSSVPPPPSGLPATGSVLTDPPPPLPPDVLRNRQ